MPSERDGDHEFVPQSLGSAYCGNCRRVFHAPEHNYILPERLTPESNESVASDLLENMERDIAEDRQARAEEFSDEWD